MRARSFLQRSLGLLLSVGILASIFSHRVDAATFSIRVTDGAGEGLNDTTPFTPVGGNNATTLGEARMNLLQEAARIWGTLLQSNVTILVDAAFDPQTCSATSGTLGSAGPRAIYRNFGGGVSPDTYYVSALADALAGANQSSNPTAADIGATFNSNVDSDSTCLGGRGFYYGFDHSRGTKLDLLLVVLHEFGHGLGFTSQVNLSTGRGFIGSDNVERFDSYTYRLFDEQFNANWPALTAQQRIDSASHTGLLAWSGTSVNAQAGRFSQGVTGGGRIRIYAPATVASGSSVSHFDTALTPSVLMEPNLPSSITTSSTDITVCALQDIGWTVNVCPHDATNHAPIANAQSVTTLEDTAKVITLTGSDSDNDVLSFAIAVPPTKGTLSAISTSTPRTVTYTPSANATGADSFSFTVSDGSVNSSPAVVAVSITATNDAPAAQNLNVTASTAQLVPVSLIGTDVDGDALTYTVVSNPTNGTLTGSGATLSYQSNSGYVGSDSFTYRVSDGTLVSNVATVTISVAAVQQSTFTDSSGGGGSIDITLAGLLALLFIGRGLHTRKAARIRIPKR